MNVSQPTTGCSELVLVFTQCPDAQSAARIATALVENRLAACVSMGAAVRSTYRWQGAIEHAEEVPLVAKTRRDRFAAVELAIRQWHPYEVPEILAVPVLAGSAAYLRWAADETDPDPFARGAAPAVA